LSRYKASGALDIAGDLFGALVQRCRDLGILLAAHVGVFAPRVFDVVEAPGDVESAVGVGDMEPDTFVAVNEGDVVGRLAALALLALPALAEGLRHEGCQLGKAGFGGFARPDGHEAPPIQWPSRMPFSGTRAEDVLVISAP
jgi:hypothetical protein